MTFVRVFLPETVVYLKKLQDKFFHGLSKDPFGRERQGTCRLHR